MHQTPIRYELLNGAMHPAPMPGDILRPFGWIVINPGPGAGPPTQALSRGSIFVTLEQAIMAIKYGWSVASTSDGVVCLIRRD